MKNWAEDIRIKTKNMNRGQAAEYIMNYYWYHILLGLLSLGLLVLCIYHVTWGKKRTDFSMVIVNQDINFARDEKIRDEFAKAAGLMPEHIQVDSDYIINYADVKLEGINESSYEKFFFGWGAGAIDAAVMPESFYRYCKQQNGTYASLSDLLAEAGEAASLLDEWKDALFWDDGIYTGVYADRVKLGAYFMQNEKDPYILVFPAEMTNKKAAGEFLKYSLQRPEEGGAE